MNSEKQKRRDAETLINACLEYNEQLEISDNEQYIRALINTLPYVIENKLTKKQRTVLKMLFWDKVPISDIAALCGVSQPTISNHYKAAIETLKAEMEIADAAIRNYIKLGERD